MRRSVILMAGLVACGMTMVAQEAGFFLDDWQEKTAELPEYLLMDKNASAPSVMVTVDTEQVLNRVPKYVYGNNAIDWHGDLNSYASLVKDISKLAPHVLRWPGGNLSNQYFWNRSPGDPPDDVPSGMTFRYGMNTTWSMSLDEYYQLLENTGSEGLICVNYSYARYGTGPDPVATAAHLAAEWVRYDNGRTKFWEIGNENYGTWQAGYEIDQSLNQDGQPEIINGKLYGQHSRVFLDSMRKAAAEIGIDIKIGVNVYDDETSYNSVFAAWNEGLMPEVGHLADFLAVHNYYGPYDQNSGVSVILNTHDRAGEIMDVLEADMAEAGQEMIPVAMTEWNIWAKGSMQQVSYINGIHAALILGEYIKEDYGMSNRWDLANSWNNGDDHGMFSSGGEPGVDAFNPRPVFFYMYYFQKYFGDRMVASTVSGNEDVVAWASTFSSGEMGLVLINKGGSGEIVEIDPGKAGAGPLYRCMSLTGGEDNGDFSRKVFLNGYGTDEAGGGPDDYEEVKAHAYVSMGGIEVELPAYSVVYVMIESEGPFSALYAAMEEDPRVLHLELSEEVADLDDPTAFTLVSATGGEVTISGTGQNPDSPWILDLYPERDILPGEELLLSYSGSTHESAAGEVLPAFMDMPVSNKLPGGPYGVNISLMNPQSGLALEGCSISLGDSLAVSDVDGKASLQMMEGSYELLVSGLHLDTLSEFVRVEADMTLDLELDSSLYEISFTLTEGLTGDLLSGVLVSATALEETQTTGMDGKAHFSVSAGERSWNFSKLNFAQEEVRLDPGKDTTLGVSLERSHATVKFRLRDGAQPVNGALVELDGHSLESDNLGRAIFTSVVLEKELAYTVSREDYYPAEGKLSLKSDTTIGLNMIKSVANLRFRVLGDNEPLSGATVTIGEESLPTDAEGACIFYRLPRNVAYAYLVRAEGYADLDGEVSLESDSLVEVMLNTLGMGREEDTELRIYPNPSAGELFLESERQNISGFTLVDARGGIVQEMVFSTAVSHHRIELSPGLYFIRIRTLESTVNRSLVVH